MSTSSIHDTTVNLVLFIHSFIYLNMKYFLVITNDIADPKKLCGAAFTSERKESLWK